jgi:nitrate reductase NapAB chaperone NapD
MTTEQTILCEIDKTVYHLLIEIYSTIIKVKEIKQSIDKIDNTYFYEEENNVKEKLIQIFEGETIKDLTKTLSEYRDIIELNIESTCVHKWILDTIDIDPDRSKQICYCNICGISKKG